MFGLVEEVDLKSRVGVWTPRRSSERSLVELERARVARGGGERLLSFNYVNSNVVVDVRSSRPPCAPPDPCKTASDQAQTIAATSDFVKNMLTFFFSAHLGAITDRYGRKRMLLFSILLMALPFACFSVLLQFLDRSESGDEWDIKMMKGFTILYYLTNSLTGAISFLTIIFASLGERRGRR